MAAKKPPKKKRRGMQFTEAERQLVSRMADAGATRLQISRALAISPATLKRHFAAQINGKNRRGVNAREYTAEQRDFVAAMVSFGIEQAEIAKVIGIGVPALRADFADEIANSKARANSKVAGALFRNATDYMSIQAQKFWLKTRAGWIEAQPDEVEAPEEPDLRAHLGTLDDEGRAAMRTVLEQLGAKSALTETGPEPGEPIN